MQTSDQSTIRQTLLDIQSQAKVLREQTGPSASERAVSDLRASQHLAAPTISPMRRLAIFLRSIPLVGDGLRYLKMMVMLPKVLREIQRRLDVAEQSIHSNRDAIPDINILLHENHLRKKEIETAAEELRRLSTNVNYLERKASVPAVATSGTVSQTSQALAPWLDRFYTEFENRHRGDENAIKEKHSVYLPFLEKVLERHPDAVSFDLGCGSGEWLELLKQLPTKPVGVDPNERMVAICEEKGLNVTQEDGLTKLESFADQSVAFITAFQVVEHIPFEYLMGLLLEAHRVLKPGGFILLETPNPENLIVGSCDFYGDPTHQRPIPPASLSFMVSFAGFKRQDCLRPNPASLPADLAGMSSELKEAVSRFFASPDYAIIGYKD